MAAPMSFSRAKKARMKNDDLSKKGSIDEEIVELVNFINEEENYCTTSSCSGRVIVICEGSEDLVTKKGCKWLYVSHKPADLSSVEDSLKDLNGMAVFKFEPFILHVQCCRLEDAKLMHVVAVESGFRNSGITIGKAGKVMVAVRSTHGLEVPLSDGTQLLVSSQYLAFLVQLANAKLQENSKRITRFYTNLVKRLSSRTLENLTPADNAPCTHRNRTKPDRKAQRTQRNADTNETDTSDQERLASGHEHTQGMVGGNRTNGSSFSRGGVPTTTSVLNTQHEDVVIGENGTAQDCQVQHDSEFALGVESENDDGFGFDLFT